MCSAEGEEVEPDADLHRGDRADDVLALPPDVEEPAAERKRDGEAREDEDRELDQRLLEVPGSHAQFVTRITDGAGRVPRKEPVEPRTVEDLLVRRQWVLAAEDEDDQAGDEEGKEGRDERRHDPAGALVDSEARCDAGRRPRLCRRRGGCRRLLAHAAASPFTVPPIIAMPSSSSVTSVPYSATIAPSYMTSIRSESDRISSSSSETSNTPLPRSRASTSCRWTNSIAPTSSPRVGWAARRMRRIAADLTGQHDLLLVAPGECRGPRLGTAAPDVEALEQLAGAPDDPGREQPAEAGVRLLVVVVQHQVLGEREVEHEATALAVLRNVAHAEIDDLARPGARDVPSRQLHRAGGRPPQPGEDLDELGLAVAVDARDTDDLARTNLEGDAADALEAAVVHGPHVLDL